MPSYILVGGELQENGYEQQVQWLNLAPGDWVEYHDYPPITFELGAITDLEW